MDKNTALIALSAAAADFKRGIYCNDRVREVLVVLATAASIDKAALNEALAYWGIEPLSFTQSDLIKVNMSQGKLESPLAAALKKALAK